MAKRGSLLIRLSERFRPVYRPRWNALRSRLIFETNPDYHSAVFLSAAARTGSTWISETINYRNDYRYLFEPISLYRYLLTDRYRPLLPGPEEGIIARSPYHFVHDREPIDTRLQYIRPSDADPELRARASAVLTGRFKNPAVDQYNYTPRMVFRRRLIKETKSGLWLRWLYEQFPGLKIIHLIRHPIPTIQSRLEGKTDDDPALRMRYFRKLVFGQPDLVADYLEPFRSLLESATTVFEQRMAVWCIQNYVPLRQFEPGQIHFAHYEDFCIEPVESLRKLFAYIGEPTDDRTIERALRTMNAPSSTVHGRTMGEIAGSGRIDGMKQVSKWQARATAEQLDAADRFLKAFGMDAVYSVTDPLPVRGRIRALSPSR